MNFGSTYIAALVAVVLLAVTFPIASRLARRVGDERILWLIMASMVLRLACSVMQIVVVAHAYGGVADFNGYVGHGTVLAEGFRHGNFTVMPDHTLGNEATDVVTAVVFLIVGTNQLAAFMVFSWMALIGLVAFYVALRTAAPQCDSFRYAVIVFLLPSMLFWSSAVGKEAVMTPLLGLGAWGGALMLSGRLEGLVPFVVGDALAAVVRPDEAALLFGAFFVGFLLRRRRGAGAIGIISKIGAFVVFVVGGIVLFKLTAHSAHLSHVGLGSIGKALHKTNQGNSGVGAGFGSSSYTYSSNPLDYPRDVYTVLFDPLPFQAHSLTQLLAAAENSVLILVILASWRRLSQLPRALLHEPYVVLATAYSLTFLYLFAALGNLGLLDRERTLLFPMLVVLLALPSHYERPARETAGREPALADVSSRYPMLPAALR